MKKAILLLLFISILIIELSAQRKKLKRSEWTFGIQTGNQFSLPSFNTTNDNYRDISLLRSSAGLVARRTIKKLKPKFRIGPGIAQQGVIAFDFGVNAIWSGYHYQFGEVVGTTELINWEVPFLIVLFDKKNVMLPRKWSRKGMTTYGRFGPKLGFTNKRSIEKNLEKGISNVNESVTSGGYNFLWSNSAGIIRNFKSGNIAMLEINWTQGFVNVASGSLEFSDGSISNPIVQNFNWKASYISLNAIYLFNFKNWKYLPIGKGKLEKVIYSPRYLGE